MKYVHSLFHRSIFFFNMLIDSYYFAGLENASNTHYLDCDKLAIKDITWVDDADGLREDTSHIEGCEVIGVDSEWKPALKKGSKPGKVLTS